MARQGRPHLRLLILVQALALGVTGFLLWQSERAPTSSAPPQIPHDAESPTELGRATSKSAEPSSSVPRLRPSILTAAASPVAVGRADSPKEATSPPLADRYIEVHLHDPHGHPHGVVYALPPGSPGVEDMNLVPHADVDGEVAMLPIPLPGLWDVAWGYGGRHVVAHGVEVGGGKVPIVRLSLPIASQFEILIPPWPPDLPANSRIRVSYRCKGGLEFPGRGQVRRHQGQFSASDPRGTTIHLRLTEGREVHVEAHVVPPPGHSPEPLAWAARAEPAYVRAGGSVQIRWIRQPPPPELATLTVGVRLTTPLPSHWTGLRTWLRVSLRERTGNRAFKGSVGVNPQSLTLDRDRLTLEVPPGRYVLEWKGRGFRSGQLRRVLVPAPAGRSPIIDVHPDYAFDFEAYAREQDRANQVDPSDNLRINVHLLGETLANWHGLEGEVYGLRHGDRGEKDHLFTVPLWWDQIQGDDVLDLGDPGSAFGVCQAYLGLRFAAEPTPIPHQGTFDITLVRGGLLVVVFERIPDRRHGATILERADGLPFPAGRVEKGGNLDVQVRMAHPFALGSIIGPLPPGTYVFRARLGLLSLPNVTAHVAAGETSVLVFPNGR